MGFDFSTINLSDRQARPINPIKIFQESAITDGNINDLWLAQGDALREWHDHRNDKDVAVILNTGAGKTLVGLLIAQSLVNETTSQVVYACSSIQLVEQTAEKARGYGLPVTTYHSRNFSDDLYYRAEAPCVTTYHALFNGKTLFRTHDVKAAIFDDAHAAEHILRDQFSLKISRSEMTDTYEKVVALFHGYHSLAGLETSYAELASGKSSRQFFVPPFELLRNIAELRRILVRSNLSESISTKFSWEHIQNHEDLCCLLISDSEVTLTPPVVPVFTLPYFSEEVRRVYLSATLKAPDNFARAFGRQPDKLVAPSTTAGECERMTLVPSSVNSVADDLDSAKVMIRDQKTLILVPSFLRAEAWADIAPAPSRKLVPKEVALFQRAAPPEKLILAARYDGLDLPGDKCRMMVLDELPTGTGPLETFQWENLNMQNSLRSLVATRIVQSFGRISRGMSDHGVVILTGKSLVEWLLVPRNRSMLPQFLQKQIELGEAVSRKARNTEGLNSAAEACLSRDSEWIQTYNSYMRDLPSESEPGDSKTALKVALSEARFGRSLWNRDFRRAVKELNAVLPDAISFSPFTGAWLSMWLGFAHEMDGDGESAPYFYSKARALQSNLPRPNLSKSTSPVPIPQQVLNAAEQMPVSHSNSISIEPPKTILQDLKRLDGNGSSRQVEEALRCLGQYIGLNSTRPDKEFGKGPDVLWLGELGYAVCMEVKSCKLKTSNYTKENIGQLHNHVQWVKDNHTVSRILPVFVGPLLQATNEGSPLPDTRIVELEQFEELGGRLVSAMQDAAKQAKPLCLNIVLHEVMKSRDLLYPKVLQSLDMSVLQDNP